LPRRLRTVLPSVIGRKHPYGFAGDEPLTWDMVSAVDPINSARLRFPRGGQCAPARNRSASSAAMQPIPAAVTACRKILSLTSPAANTPGTLVFVVSGPVPI